MIAEARFAIAAAKTSLIAKGIPGLVNLNELLYSELPCHDPKPGRKELMDQSLKIFLNLHEEGLKRSGVGEETGEKNAISVTDFLGLKVTAKRLKLANPELALTADPLARVQGISRRTLFRRFERGLVRQAIHDADNVSGLMAEPFSSDSSENAEDHQHILEQTGFGSS